ncbi:unnamed protein product [Onchocerca flexuosa]|uniref:Rx_N domain-containing protein n=1 Tax=Onchocerca flexuosa TaxID=387005 RepID=A0A183HSS9_9BILA|nr:unnamed protein product [Onchocerca flexuosa]
MIYLLRKCLLQVDDVEFDNYVKTVSGEVESLADTINKELAGDDSQVIEQVNVIRSDLKKALELLNSVDDIINKADRKAATIEETMNQWKLIKDRARSDLENALYYLETEGRTQWELAQEASRKYGEQSQQVF